jgi:hypothetical protein
MESKGEGSWFQAKDLSGSDFAAMSKASVVQVSGFSLLQHKGLYPDANYLCDHLKYKDRILYVQVKNKQCLA